MIRSILSHYGVSTSDRPVWQRIRCIVHDDAHESASVMTFGAHPRVRCHTCGKTWNAVELVMEMEGLDRNAAEQRAKELAGDEYRAVQPVSVSGGRLPGKPRTFSGVRKW